MLSCYYVSLNLDTWKWEGIFCVTVSIFLAFLGFVPEISEISFLPLTSKWIEQGAITSSFGEYKLIKVSFDYDFITWQSKSSLKNVWDTSSTLEIRNLWTKQTLELFKPFFVKDPMQCKLLLPVKTQTR